MSKDHRIVVRNLVQTMVKLHKTSYGNITFILEVWLPQLQILV
jgi:hypothetical protein